ncbi:DUF2786 domain-containing protein [Chroococcidiopsis sp. FACHB-1243]|nr:DUF2786 domain-containing protein [Chroococcidiopsis sp. [FACHB-1243]]
MAKERQSIIERVHKLLALSTSSNENEAAQAAAKAQELLMQYNLSLDDVTLADAVRSDCIGAEDLESYRRKVLWKGSLASAIANANFCNAWWSGGKIEVAGKPHNRAVVRSIYQYLVVTVERLAKLALKQERQNYQMYLDQFAGASIASSSEPNWRNWKSSFIAGCVSRLCERLKEQTHRMQTEGIPNSNVSALICRQAYEKEREAIAFWQQEKGICLRKSTRSRVGRTRDAYNCGRAAGEAIGLNKQVNPKRVNLLQG